MGKRKFQIRSLILNISILLLSLGFNLNAQKLDWEIVHNIKPPTRVQQTSSLVLDIDGDGLDDFVITERRNSPSVVWYKFNGTTWDKNFIETEPLHIEAGGTYLDVDNDGDLDIVFGGDNRLNQIWWWENPSPNFDKNWNRYTIKNHGGKKHHDQIVGDFDNDGILELVSWNQEDSVLIMFEIPKNPKTAKVWDHTVIYSGIPDDEGLAVADINKDGKLDIIGAGKWFENMGNSVFTPHVIDKEMNYTRTAVGQLVKGGTVEVLFCPGDRDGEVRWYEWKNDKWIPHVLTSIIHGHSVDIKDFDKDGNMDIFLGEMGGVKGAGKNSNIMIYYGNGKGNFLKDIVRTGQGIHEGKVGDLNGDGTLDILVKPYLHNSPKVEVILGKLKMATK